MDVWIGLPNAVPGTTGEQLTEWARRAEARGFSTLGTIDRIVYGNYEPLVALAAAAAVTERIGLSTSVLLGPLRENAASVAKQALSIHALSGGRMTLGIGLGGRDDDYELAEVAMDDRGDAIDAMLAKISEVWDHELVGPDVPDSPDPAGRRRRRRLLRARRQVRRRLDRRRRCRRKPSPKRPRRSKPSGRPPAARASRGWSASPTSRSATAPRRTPRPT